MKNELVLQCISHNPTNTFKYFTGKQLGLVVRIELISDAGIQLHCIMSIE
jgi:hypothetical protein